MTGTVKQLFVTPRGSAPMEGHESVEAVDGGFEGDRYRKGTGHYSPHDVCEATFIESEAIEEIREEFDIDLTDGRHRRNVVTRGVDVHDLLGATFRVGDAVFVGTRPRPPCAHVEEVADEAGVTRALKNERGGICADVDTPGTLEIGDGIEVLEDGSVGRRLAARFGLD